MNSAMLLPWVALLTPLTVIGWTLGSQRGRRRRLDRWFGATLLSFAALALLDLWSPSSTLDPDTLYVTGDADRFASWQAQYGDKADYITWDIAATGICDRRDEYYFMAPKQ